jgi:transcriptional regulator with XRE-family HTH domain
MGAKDSEKRLRQQLGRELRRARLALSLTQADVAERVETDPETISRFERGTSLPSLTRLLTLAEALGVTLATLLGRASPRASDELDELHRSLSRLSEDDRRLATALMRTIVEERGHPPTRAHR